MGLFSQGKTRPTNLGPDVSEGFQLSPYFVQKARTEICRNGTQTMQFSDNRTHNQERLMAGYLFESKTSY